MSKAERLIEIILISILALMTGITFYQIVGRYLFQKTPFWSEQSVLLLLNYMVFIGIPLLLWKKQHIGFDFVVNKLPLYLQKAALCLQSFLLLIFGGIMSYYSLSLLLKVKGHQVATLSISQSVTYVPVVLSGLAIILISLLNMKRQLWKS